MPFVVGLSVPSALDRGTVGGKAAALAVAHRSGFSMPGTFCITTEAYRAFVRAGRLEGSIAMEIDRKDFADMRWEELWDGALRIRNRFLATPVPPEIEEQVAAAVGNFPAGSPLAVRSSSVAEDASGTSFAGLHESYVNVRAGSLENLIDHVKLVWASLWSDRALLYRREMGLDVSRSAMAVVVQELVTGASSGVLFTQAPERPGHMMIEAVYGLNQGLVDGTVEPDRWLLVRPSGRIIRHAAPEERWELVGDEGGRLAAIPVRGERSLRPPLASRQIRALGELGMGLEESFGSPQDIEWTFGAQGPVLLQCRPITAGAGRDDERSWYLSLRRSLANLRDLRKRVEEELIPHMDADADRREARDLATFSDAEVDAEILLREELLSRWEATYRDECIPLAHGVRLFGEIYNDLMRPEDPFEFVLLLTGTGMESLARNRAIQELAQQLSVPGSAGVPRSDSFARQIAAFLARHGDLMFGGLPDAARQEALLQVLARYGARPRPAGDGVPPAAENLKTAFLETFPDGPGAAQDLLDLARASYRLRDDDNIHLGRIRTLVLKAKQHRDERAGRSPAPAPPGQVDPNYPARSLFPKTPAPLPGAPRTRQIVGQPASRGIGQGSARVIASPDDLRGFLEGEILVCDAIDPTMTWICPIAAGIVERRGGMLIHGAIIAREYGIPCVTGVPGATSRIRTGDRVTVDGFLGVVVVHGRDD